MTSSGQNTTQVTDSAAHQTLSATGQEPLKKENVNEVVAFGLGIGMDYGGFGLNLSGYPIPQIGAFLGFGYALAGVGYNIGAKIRFVSTKNWHGVAPYLSGMYGYNGAVIITNEEKYNKLFYGITAGGGIDIRNRKNNNSFSLELLVPFRGNEVDEYMSDLSRYHNIEFKNKLWPVGVSFGYKWAFY